MNLNRLCYFLMGLSFFASAFFPYPLTSYFLIINVLILIIYGTDKLAARKAWQRVPEFTLLIFGLIGGWPGAILAQQLFRHKTQKQPFKSYFLICIVLNVAALAVIYIFIIHGNQPTR